MRGDTVNRPPPDFETQLGRLLELVAGYVGHRTAEIGVEQGLFDQLAAHPNGVTAATLATETGLDPDYLEVWCRSTNAAGLLEESNGAYRIEPVTATLLTDRRSPAYMGGLFSLLDQPEVFDLFTVRLRSGERTWWDRFSPDFVRRVADTSRPAYLRLIPGGLEQVPGLDGVLARRAAVLELACGAGFGLVHLARTYPAVRLVGVDGDAYSLQLAAAALADAGVGHRAELHHSTLEDLCLDARFDLAVINLAMHECRDLDLVTDNIRRALRPGGYLVVSDFPFPDTAAGLRTVAGRIMSGIQFLEAQIGDQLLPVTTYVDVLEKHGFDDVDAFEITATHAVVHGRVLHDRSPRGVGG